MKRGLKTLICLFIGISIFAACSSIQSLTNSRKPSPHVRYLKKIEDAGLDQTAMVKAWLEAADPALHDSVMVTLPFQETGYFASSEPQARFYRFDVKAGQVLTLTSVIKSKNNAHVFADLFFREEGNWKPREHADTSMTLTYEFKDTGTCLVRLQPELLVNAFYSITLSVTPVLLNPVKGASNKSIGSFYGDTRDGGKRKHEGIDIFAPKGTPVVAPTAGVITRVANGGLGGKTVWMRDLKRGHSYYFAHLDSQYVRSGAKVKQGDALGTVGNTGNAATTPAHLHFGVYQNSSIDPIAYIRTMERLVNELAPDTLFQSVVFKVKSKQALLYAGPSDKLPKYGMVLKDHYLKVIAQSKDWYRIITAHGAEAFVEKKNVLAATSGNKIQLKRSAVLLSDADENAVPITSLIPQKVETIAIHEGFRYVKTAEGLIGWISIRSL